MADTWECVVFAQHCHVEPAIAHLGFKSSVQVVGAARYAEACFVDHPSEQIVGEVFFIVQFGLGVNCVAGSDEVCGSPIDIGNNVGF